MGRPDSSCEAPGDVWQVEVEGGDHGHSETTYLSNCLFYHTNSSVALRMNSPRQGAAGGSRRGVLSR